MRLNNGRWLMATAVAISGLAQTQVDLGKQSRNLDFSGGPVKPFQTGASLPPACSLGHAFMLTTAPAGKNIYLCTATNTWTPQGSAVDIPSAPDQPGRVLTTTGSGAQWAGIEGDVSGGPDALVVGRIRGRAVSSASPAGGQVLTWNSITNEWQPSSAPSNYSLSFAEQSTVLIPASWHGYSTPNLVVDCYDPSQNRVEPHRVAVDPASYDVTVTFSTPQSGRCVVNGAGSAGGSGLPNGLSNGQVLTWSGTEGRWYPGSGTAGLQVTRTSPTVLTIGTGCSLANPCTTRIGGSIYAFQAPATVTITGGDGSAAIYVAANGLLSVANDLGAACSAGCVTVSGDPAFPASAAPLAMWTASDGVWSTAGTDWRSWLSSDALNAGLGVTILSTAGARTIAIDPTVVSTYISGMGTLDFGPIPQGACSGDLTITVFGASPGDTVIPGWPAAMASGLIGMMRATATDTVAARLCNLTGSQVDPPAAVFTATILRSF